MSDDGHHAAQPPMSVQSMSLLFFRFPVLPQSEIGAWRNVHLIGDRGEEHRREVGHLRSVDSLGKCCSSICIHQHPEKCGMEVLGLLACLCLCLCN